MRLSEQGASPLPATVAIVLVSTLFVLSLVLVALRAAIPTDGVFVNNGEALWQHGRLTAQWPTSSGIPVGAEVRMIQGRTPAGWAAHSLRTDHVSGAAAPANEVTYLIRTRAGVTREVTLTLHPYPVKQQIVTNWPAVTWVLLIALVGVYLLRRRPRALVAQLVASSAGLQSVAAVAWVFGFVGYDITSPVRMASWVLAGLAYLLLWCCGVHFALVFPLRQPLVTRHPRLVPAVYVAIPALHLVSTAGYALASDVEQPWATVALTPTLPEQAASQLLLVVFLLLGYRACADPGLRRQLRLVGLAIGSAAAAFGALVTIPTMVSGGALLSGPLQPLLFVPVPLSIAAAVVRHQMLDVTVVVNRSVTWLTMTVLVVGGYVAVVSVLSLLFAQWFHPASSVVASALVALTFQPAHRRIQAFVNRWTYGERDPDLLATALAGEIAGAPTPEEALSSVVRLLGTQLRLPAVALEMTTGTRVRWPGRPPDPPVLGEHVPLTYQGNPVAHLIVSWPPGRGGRQLDRELIAHLAPQLGMVVHVAQLTADVRSIRDRIVLAREEERRRIYRDLHDGTAATLAATVLHLQVVQAGLAENQTDLRATLGRLVCEIRAAAEGVRRLMDDLSPPVLHELGLVRALQEKAATFSTDSVTGPTIVVHAEDLPTFPTAVEVAAFRIVVEGMVNVIRHARARRCTVRLTYDGALRICVYDDGAGLPAPVMPGVGMRSIRARAAELGGFSTIRPARAGGTELIAVLPLPAERCPPRPGSPPSRKR